LAERLSPEGGMGARFYWYLNNGNYKSLQNHHVSNNVILSEMKTLSFFMVEIFHFVLDDKTSGFAIGSMEKVAAGFSLRHQ
jgi:hypothetical protein